MSSSEAGRARVPKPIESKLKQIRLLRKVPLSRSRVFMAAKAAIAGAIAWYAAQLIPGATAYAYYAPFGAVIAMTFSIADSLRQCVRSVAAIAIGAGLALGAGTVIHLEGAAVAVIIFVGLLIAAWHSLGTMGGWIPMTALFVLIIGDVNPGQFVGAYVGLTLLGAVIATVVNIAIPPMPVAAYGRLEDQMRGRLADHVDGLADWLDSGGEESRTDLDEQRVLTPLLHELWSATDRTSDEQRVNPRARWHATRAARQQEAARRLERLIYLAQEISHLVAQGLVDGRSDCLDADERSTASGALRAYAATLRWAGSGSRTERQRIADGSEAVRRFANAVGSDTDWLAISMVVSIRRSLQILLPEPFQLSEATP